LFYDNANKFIDLLELCNNTTLDVDDVEEPVQAQAAQ
jgi:hypothetical protein